MTPAEQNTATLTPFLHGVEIGKAIGHLNLTLVPLRGGRREHLDYMPGSEAIADGTLTITEVSEGGSVPELLALNEGPAMILLLDGEELVGAKQNRILNTSVLLPPKSRTKIPVSCVEQGRWHSISEGFKSGSHSHARLRAHKSRDVTRNLTETGEARSDQSRVWEEVACLSHETAVNSATSAMSDVVKQHRGTIDGYVNALKYPEGSCGIIAAINGRFVALDLMDRAQTLAAIWDRLLSGYSMDALMNSQDKEAAGAFTAKGAKALLEHLAEIPCKPCPTVGLGEDWRFEAADVLGQALIVDNVCVHLSAFPNEPAEQRDGQSIQPPSARRRVRRRGGGEETVY